MYAQVPQYIDIEDKIIGPLTLKQFLYLLIGGGIIFLLFSIFKFSVFIIIAIPIVLFTILLAFFKIGNQKFGKFIANFLGFISRPDIYTWKKLPQKTMEEKPASKIIEKAKPLKKIPEKSGLEETWWRIEVQK